MDMDITTDEHERANDFKLLLIVLMFIYYLLKEGKKNIYFYGRMKKN